uniref:Uncharacterized protein n=1 Tax=Triticum urartu TaxID=4572 RepID=A0A8R7QU07_TRIUA
MTCPRRRASAGGHRGRSGRRQWLGVGAGSRSVVGLSSSATCVFVFQASDREEVVLSISLLSSPLV